MTDEARSQPQAASHRAVPTHEDVAARLVDILPTAPVRRVRLFSLACMRRVRHLLKDTFCDALDVAERHVDGDATNTELGSAVRAVKRASGRRHDQEWAVYYAVRHKADRAKTDAANIAQLASNIARDAVALPERCSPAHFDMCGFAVSTLLDEQTGQWLTMWSTDEQPPVDSAPKVIAAFDEMRGRLRALENDHAEKMRQKNEPEERALQAACTHAQAARRTAYAAECAAQLEFLDDLFPASRISPLTQFCRQTSLVEMAVQIYRDHSFGRMPMLGEALETSGCVDPVVLDHCRRETLHARGCWVLDALMMKS